MKEELDIREELVLKALGLQKLSILKIAAKAKLDLIQTQLAITLLLRKGKVVRSSDGFQTFIEAMRQNEIVNQSCSDCDR